MGFVRTSGRRWRQSLIAIALLCLTAVPTLSASTPRQQEVRLACADQALALHLAAGEARALHADLLPGQRLRIAVVEQGGSLSMSAPPDGARADMPYPGASVQMAVLRPAGRPQALLRADADEAVRLQLLGECLSPGIHTALGDLQHWLAQRLYRRLQFAAPDARDDLLDWGGLSLAHALATLADDPLARTLSLRAFSYLADQHQQQLERIEWYQATARSAGRARLSVLEAAGNLGAAQAAIAQGEYASAAILLDAAAAAARAAGHPGLAAVIRNDDCILLRFQGFNAQAAGCYLTAIETFRALAPHSAWARLQLANSLSGRSYALLQTGELDEALTLSTEVEGLLKQMSGQDPVTQLYRARIGLLSGDVERFRGRVEQALQHYRQSLDLLQSRPQANVWLGWTWLRLGLTQRLIDEPELAHASLWHALQLPEVDSSPDLRGLVHLALGRLALSTRDPATAAGHFMQAWVGLSGMQHAEQMQARLGLAEASEMSGSRFWSRYWLAGVDSDRLPGAAVSRSLLLQARIEADSARALQLAATAELRAARSGDLLGLIDAAVATSRIQRQAGDLAAAADAALRALDATLTLADQVSVPALRGAMLARSTEALEALLQAELQPGDVDDQQRILHLWAALEAVNAGAAQTAVRPAQGAAAGPHAPALLPREVEGLAAAALLSQSMPAAQQAQTDLRLVQLLTRLHAAPGGATTAHDGVARVQVVGHVLPALQSRLRAFGPGRAVVSYFLSRDLAVVFVGHQGRVSLHRIAQRSAVHARLIAAEGPAAISALDVDEMGALSRALLPTRLARESVEQLVIVGTDAMARFPFAALADPAEPNGAAGSVLDRFRISHSPSVLQAAAAAPVLPAIEAGHPVLALVDPHAPSSGLPRLRGARAEGDDLQSRFGSDAVQVLSGKAATVAAFTEALRVPHGVLHLGVHGLVDVRRPLLSSLVLADEHEGPGLLSLQNLPSLTHQTGLLVLTACSSADGRVRRGEGTQSLARGFLQSGSEQVLAALWPVGDAASAAFSGHFYAALSESWQPADALAAAQRRMRDSAHWSQPVDWAGMVLYESHVAR